MNRLLKFSFIVCALITISGFHLYDWVPRSTGATWEGNQALFFFVEEDFPDGAETTNAVIRAMDTWSNIKGSSMRYFHSFRDDAHLGGMFDGKSLIRWTALGDCRWYSGITYMRAALTGPRRIKEVHVKFNDHCSVGTSVVALESVALHEFGHAFGLGHEFFEPAAMNYEEEQSQEEFERVRPMADDYEGLRYLYPKSGESAVDIALSSMTDWDDDREMRPVSPAFIPQISAQVSASIPFTIENRGNSAINGVKVKFKLKSRPGNPPGTYDIAEPSVFNLAAHSSATVVRDLRITTGQIPPVGFNYNLVMEVEHSRMNEEIHLEDNKMFNLYGQIGAVEVISPQLSKPGIDSVVYTEEYLGYLVKCNTVNFSWNHTWTPTSDMERAYLQHFTVESSYNGQPYVLLANTLEKKFKDCQGDKTLLTKYRIQARSKAEPVFHHSEYAYTY